MSAHTSPAASAPPPRRPMTLPRLLEMHRQREPIAMLTCYDASFAALLDEAGVDTVLVGDSLGMVVQ
ncbi:MAG: 3-methyl-2-oxobutanoate hydroxymethyltransferase, partial [Burkholderiaceae bacterium]|nr:3-methyl-2-oxobutanoate hydroxymethyltransferase [Burkholderiaceae bacterium]